MDTVIQPYLDILENQIKLFNKNLNKKIRVKDFADLYDDVRQIFLNIEIETSFIREDIALTQIGIHSIAMLSFVFDEEYNVLTGEWTEKEYVIVHNTIKGLLTQLANGFLGILKLIEAGLDFQARALFRNVVEMSWLTIVLFNDMNWLKKYIQGDPYAKFFEPYKVRGKLTEIENKTHLPKAIKKTIISQRKKIYKFYSEIIHNVYPTPILGTWVAGFSEEDILTPNLFGKISVSSKRTLSEVNSCIFLFLLFFFRALVDVHRFKVKGDQVDFFITRSKILKETFIEGYLLSLQK